MAYPVYSDTSSTWKTPNCSPTVSSHSCNQPIETKIEITVSNNQSNKNEKKLKLMYEQEDEDYDEPYLNELVEDISTGVQTDLALGDKLESESLNSLRSCEFINSNMKEHEIEEFISECSSRIEIPWQDISLPVPGPYVISRIEKTHRQIFIPLSEEHYELASDRESVGENLDISENKLKQNQEVEEKEAIVTIRENETELSVDEQEYEEVKEQQEEIKEEEYVQEPTDETKQEIFVEAQDNVVEKEEFKEAHVDVHNSKFQVTQDEHDGNLNLQSTEDTRNNVKLQLFKENGEHSGKLIATEEELQRDKLQLTENEKTSVISRQSKRKFEFLFESADCKYNEPYMDSLYRSFLEDDKCDSHTEMPWNDILLPKNCKISQNLQKCTFKTNSDNNVTISKPSLKSIHKEEDDIIDIHYGIEDYSSTIIPVLSSVVTRASSMHSDIHGVPTRSLKKYTLHLDISQEGQYDVFFQSGNDQRKKISLEGELYSSTSFPFSISAKQNFQKQTSSIVINIQPLEMQEKNAIRPTKLIYKPQKSISMPHMSSQKEMKVKIANKQSDEPLIFSERVILSPERAIKMFKIPGQSITINFKLAALENSDNRHLQNLMPSLDVTYTSDVINLTNQDNCIPQRETTNLNLSAPIDVKNHTNVSNQNCNLDPVVNQRPRTISEGSNTLNGRPKPSFKDDPVGSVLKTYEDEMKPLKEALELLQTKLQSIDMPELKARLRPSPQSLEGKNVYQRIPMCNGFISYQNPIEGISQGYPNICSPNLVVSQRLNSLLNIDAYSSLPEHQNVRNRYSIKKHRQIVEPQPFRMELHPFRVKDSVVQAGNYGMYPDYRRITYPDQYLAYNNPFDNTPGNFSYRISPRSPKNFAEQSCSYRCAASNSCSRQSSCVKNISKAKSRKSSCKSKPSQISSRVSLDLEEACFACKLRPGQALKTSPEDFLPKISNVRTQYKSTC